MICNKILLIGLSGFLFLGCAPLTKIALSPGSPEDLAACSHIFPSGAWESVHKIEADVGGSISSSLLGITQGDPERRRLHSLLLTPEGFILFEGSADEDGTTIQKALPPFDSLTFARGLMEDVSILFLSPSGMAKAWGKDVKGFRFCVWESPNGFQSEVRELINQDWQILYRDAQGDLIKEVFLRGPFINGLAGFQELTTFRPRPYKLRMTLLQNGH